MASSLKNLSEFNSEPKGNYSAIKIGIVVSEWNTEITSALLDGAKEALLKYGVWENHIKLKIVPGAFELTYGAQQFAKQNDFDGVICLGCVIKGDTKHDDYINHAVAQGLTNVSLKYDKPVIFGLVTTNDFQQAKERSGGKHGNKGTEGAVTLLKMLSI